jgi:hypothetical protein
MLARRSRNCRPGVESVETRYLLSASAIVHPAADVHDAARGGCLDRGESMANNFQRVQVNTGRTPDGKYTFAVVTVTNGTSTKITAGHGFRVTVRGETVPILKAGQEWGPGQKIVFFSVNRELLLPPEFKFSLGGNEQIAGSRTYNDLQYPRAVNDLRPESGTPYTLLKSGPAYVLTPT